LAYRGKTGGQGAQILKGGFMNLEVELKDIHHEFTKRREMARTAFKLYESIKDLLPPHWVVGVAPWGILIKDHVSYDLDFIKIRKETDWLEQYNAVCAIVVQACSGPLKKEAWTTETGIFCLHASGEYEKYRLEVRLFETDKCEVEFVEVTKREAVVKGKCLGA
jgi:hypothetical protein